MNSNTNEVLRRFPKDSLNSNSVNSSTNDEGGKWCKTSHNYNIATSKEIRSKIKKIKSEVIRVKKLVDKRDFKNACEKIKYVKKLLLGFSEDHLKVASVPSIHTEIINEIIFDLHRILTMSMLILPALPSYVADTIKSKNIDTFTTMNTLCSSCDSTKYVSDGLNFCNNLMADITHYITYSYMGLQSYLHNLQKIVIVPHMIDSSCIKDERLKLSTEKGYYVPIRSVGGFNCNLIICSSKVPTVDAGTFYSSRYFPDATDFNVHITHYFDSVYDSNGNKLDNILLYDNTNKIALELTLFVDSASDSISLPLFMFSDIDGAISYKKCVKMFEYESGNRNYLYNILVNYLIFNDKNDSIPIKTMVHLFEELGDDQLMKRIPSEYINYINDGLNSFLPYCGVKNISITIEWLKDTLKYIDDNEKKSEGNNNEFSKKFVLACILDKETFDYFDKNTDVTSNCLPVDDVGLANYIIHGKISIPDTEYRYHNKREFLAHRDKLCKKFNTECICGVEVEDVYEFVYSITDAVGSIIINHHLDIEDVCGEELCDINNIISFIDNFTPGILPDNKSEHSDGNEDSSK